MTAHGDPKTSKVVGRRLDELDLPPGATVGAILRGDEVIIAHRHVVVEEDDHVILFLTDPSKISLVEKTVRCRWQLHLMNIGLCVRIVGLLLMLFSLGTLPSMTLGWLQEDGTATIFGQALRQPQLLGFSFGLQHSALNQNYKFVMASWSLRHFGSFWVSMVRCHFC